MTQLRLSFHCSRGTWWHRLLLPPVWGFIDTLSLFIVMSVCTVSLQALRAFQAWSSWRWMSLYQRLSTLLSGSQLRALGCLKFPARFSKPLTESPEPRGDWPRGFARISPVPAGFQPLNKTERWGWCQPPPSGAGWEGLEMWSPAANPLQPRTFSSVGTWRTENPTHSREGSSGIRLERLILPPLWPGTRDFTCDACFLISQRRTLGKGKSASFRASWTPWGPRCPRRCASGSAMEGIPLGLAAGSLISPTAFLAVSSPLPLLSGWLWALLPHGENWGDQR